MSASIREACLLCVRELRQIHVKKPYGYDVTTTDTIPLPSPSLLTSHIWYKVEVSGKVIVTGAGIHDLFYEKAFSSK